MFLQNPFQFNLVEIFKIHLFKTYLWNVYCMSRSKLDMRNRVSAGEVQMAFTFKRGDGQQIQ